MDAVRSAVQQKIYNAVISTAVDCESCDGTWQIASPAARRIIATTQNSQWPGSIFLINCSVRLTWIYCVRKVVGCKTNKEIRKEIAKHYREEVKRKESDPDYQMVSWN